MLLWQNGDQHEVAKMSIMQRLERENSEALEQERRTLQSVNESIQYMTRELRANHDRRIRIMRDIQRMQENQNVLNAKIYHELDKIVSHKKVKSLEIHDTKYVIHTHPIYVHHDRTGERYYLGNYQIVLKPRNTQVLFYSDNPRRSFWSGQDHHPHVSEGGAPCLGNVQATIAELCSSMELFALTMVCIDFLESVNTSDPAGAYIGSWDKVDENGTIIEYGTDCYNDEGEDMWSCDSCEESFNENDGNGRQVYASYAGGRDGQGHWGAERYVCGECCDEYYTLNEYLDEYIRDGHCNIERDDDELLSDLEELA